jgi:hypothetical protein
MFVAYVRAVRGCANWNIGNMLGEVLPEIERLTDTQIDGFVSAFNETPELRSCFALTETMRPIMVMDSPACEPVGKAEVRFN